MWDVKEPTHYSKRVGHEVPGVVAVLSEWVQCCTAKRVGHEVPGVVAVLSEWVQCCTAHLNIINRKCAI